MPVDSGFVQIQLRGWRLEVEERVGCKVRYCFVRKLSKSSELPRPHTFSLRRSGMILAELKFHCKFCTEPLPDRLQIACFVNSFSCTKVEGDRTSSKPPTNVPLFAAHMSAAAF